MCWKKILTVFIFASVSLLAGAQIRIIPQERLDSLANPPLAPDAANVVFERECIVAEPMNQTDPPGTFEFCFINKGSKPVRITRLVSTCSCAQAGLVNREIGPGTKGKIDVRYNPYGHPGHFVRRIFVYTDDNTQPTAVLKLDVTVK